jgi:hypothetical protein
VLSLQRCREILEVNCPLTDDELESLRDHMYGLAGVIVDQIGDAQANASNTDQTG